MPRWDYMTFPTVVALVMMVVVCMAMFFASAAWLIVRCRTMPVQQWWVFIFLMLFSGWGLNLLLITWTYYMWWRGGTAWNGGIDHGHYFLGRGSRHRVEVSRSTFWISWWHCAVTFGGPWVLILIASVKSRLNRYRHR